MESSELKISEYAQSIIQSGLATSRLWKKQGEDAWSALKKLGQHNLPDGDEIILAKNIYSEYANFAKKLSLLAAPKNLTA